MNTLFVTIILAILAIAIVWRLVTRPGKRSRPKRVQSENSSSRPEDRTSTQWRAVQIAPGLLSCDAASKLAGEVFLSSESPRLPLDGCIEKDCRCKYVHLQDRRDGGDRRIELGEFGAFFPTSEVERRRVAGRRSMDLAV
jgi:hypothetical protein